MITPIENNGMVLRMQDFSTVRQNEENHAANQHVVIRQGLEKTEESNAHTVRKKDDADGSDTHHDAREQGKNKYVNNRKKNSRDGLAGDGVVVPKGKGGFDMTI